MTTWNMSKTHGESNGYSYMPYAPGKSRAKAIANSIKTKQRFALTAGMTRHWTRRCAYFAAPYDLLPSAAVSAPGDSGPVSLPIGAGNVLSMPSLEGQTLNLREFRSFNDAGNSVGSYAIEVHYRRRRDLLVSGSVDRPHR